MRERREAEAQAARLTADLVRHRSADYHDSCPGDIPYGVQRLLSVALAYGAGAKVLLLDEPAAGIGGGDMKRLADLLIELAPAQHRARRDRAPHGPDHVDRRPHRHDRPGRDARHRHAGGNPARRAPCAKPIWGATNDRRARLRKSHACAMPAMSRSSASPQRARGQDGRPRRRQRRRQIHAGQCVRRLVARPRQWSPARYARWRRTSSGLAAHERVAARAAAGAGRQEHLRRTDGRRKPRRWCAPPRGHHRPPCLHDSPTCIRFLPAARRAAQPQGRARCRAASGRCWRSGARCWQPARADARRAVGRPRAAPDLDLLSRIRAAGRPRPAGAAGRTERQGGAQGGRPSLSARARPDRRRGTGAGDGSRSCASSRPISARSPRGSA